MQPPAPDGPEPAPGATPREATPSDGPLRVVLCTAPPAAALELARHLVEERRAACVNLIPGVTSVYRWQGAVQQDDEVLLVCKTTAAALPGLERRLLELHPYDVPEVVALAPERVESRYAAWLLGEVDGVG